MHSKLIIGLFAAALLASCSDDDDDGGGGPLPAQALADVVIGDAPVDDLLAFSATVESARVRRQDGTFTGNLMTGGPVEIEFLGLDDAFMPLGRGILDEATYTGVEIRFTPGSYAAVAEDGSEVVVTSTSDLFIAPFAAPFVVDVDQYARMEVDLDLLASLDGDVAGGTLTFGPEGDTAIDDGGTAVRLDEFKGLVTEANEAGAEFTVEGFLDDEQAVSIGPVDVIITGATLFIDETRDELDAPGFFAVLTANQTLVEVYGSLSQDGLVVADRVEIEDQAGGAGSDLVRVEGQIVGSSLNAFMLRVIEIDDGASTAGPIIDSLGSSDLEVAYDVDTLFIVGRDGLSDSTEVVIGRRVKVEFCSFTTPPFLACIVDVDDVTPAFDGAVTDVTGLPDEFVMQMDAGEVAITSGLVQDENTDVIVDLTASALVLGTDGEPALVADDVTVGLEAEVEGDFSGLPAAPTLQATRVRIQPGFLKDALVTVADRANARFLTTGGTIVDDFGPNVAPGAQQVFIQPGATFSGDVGSVEELFDLLESAQGAKALIDVRGLGNDVANEIRAYHVDAQAPGA